MRKPTFPKKVRRERGASYPWDRWLDGRTHVIRHERDFGCSVRTMQVYLHNRAARHDRTVSTLVDEDVIVFTASKRKRGA
jgi:hypothetical protein